MPHPDQPQLTNQEAYCFAVIVADYEEHEQFDDKDDAEKFLAEKVNRYSQYTYAELPTIRLVKEVKNDHTKLEVLEEITKEDYWNLLNARRKFLIEYFGSLTDKDWIFKQLSEIL